MSVKTTTLSTVAWLLTVGASLTLGLLSFASIFILAPTWPFIIPLAGVSFVLATVYQAEIYKQNINNGAFAKLFGVDYTKKFLAKKLLLTLVNEASNRESCEFLSIYYAAMIEHDKYDRNNLSATDNDKEHDYAKNLDVMETLFTQLMFAKRSNGEASTFEAEVFKLVDSEQESMPTSQLAKLHSDYRTRQWINRSVLLLCIIVGIAETVGTALLLTEIIPVLSLLAISSANVIVPVILIASPITGLAILFLTYNALTYMIEDRTFQKMYENIAKRFKRNKTLKLKDYGKIALNILAILAFIAFSAVLTYITAGAWWAMAAEIGPILSYLKFNLPFVFKIVLFVPLLVFRFVQTLVMGIADTIFNMANIIETVTILSELLHKAYAKHQSQQGLVTKQKSLWHIVLEKRNILQVLNPFSIVYAIKFGIRYALFSAHIVNVDGGQPSSLSNFAVAFLTALGELSTDLHYFIPHADDFPLVGQSETAHDPVKYRLDNKMCDHSAESDLPSKVLNMLFWPIAVLGATWDWATSQFNRFSEHKHPVNWIDAYHKYRPKFANDAASNFSNGSQNYSELLSRFELEKSRSEIIKTLRKLKDSRLQIKANDTERTQQKREAVDTLIHKVATSETPVDTFHQTLFCEHSTPAGATPLMTILKLQRNPYTFFQTKTSACERTLKELSLAFPVESPRAR